MKRFYLSLSFCFLFLILSTPYSNVQRVVSEKTETNGYGGKTITRVTADDLGIETVTEDAYDKKDELKHRRVIKKTIDGDKVLTNITDTFYYKSFISTTAIGIRDISGNLIFHESYTYDKEGNKKNGMKFELNPAGDYQNYDYNVRTDSWKTGRITKDQGSDGNQQPRQPYNLPNPDFKYVPPLSTNIISMGLKGGVNLASLHTNNDDNNDIKTITSFHAGAFVNFPLANQFHFQPEFVFSRQGCKSETQIGETRLEDELNLTYLQLPLMFQWQTPSGFFVEAGPQAGYLIKATYKADGETLDLLDQDVMNKFDFSVNGGAGYTSKAGLGAYIRYMYGLSNIWNNDNGFDEKATNRVFSFGVQYRFVRK